MYKILKEGFNLAPSANEAKSGVETLEASSSFESRMTYASIKDLDIQAINQWLKNTGETPTGKRVISVIEQSLRTRGLMWYDQKGKAFHALASGIVFFGKNPALHFPQCKIMLDAYKGNEIDPRPLDQDTFSLPAPLAIERVIEFIHKNTRHPPVIKGILRIMLDEYPEKAVREAVVNAIAHRDYEDGARNIMIALYHNRIVIASPGFPPKPLTIAKLMNGKYLPCSRNPVIAQSLASLGLMEQRGSGIGRMRAAMLDHGLDGPRFELGDGYFQVILSGPGEDLKKLKVPNNAGEFIIPPSVESQLNERQKEMILMLNNGLTLTSRVCESKFGITRPTAASDFAILLKLGFADKEGSGRSSRYVLTRNNR